MLQLEWTQPPNDYPTSDGKPMGETDAHRDLMVDLIATLDYHFRDRHNVYVSGDILWFYRQGDRRRHISPDVLVCFGVPKGQRENFLQWEEGCAPQVVIEVTSKSTRSEETRSKYFRYEELGVEEYYLFDPRQEYLKPRFRSYHRRGEAFVPVVGDMVYSPRLELDLVVIQNQLRFRCPVSGEVLPTPGERAARAEKRATQAEAQLRAEAERAQRLAERLRRLGIDPND